MECLRQLWTAGIWYWSRLPLTGNYIASAAISFLVILCALSAFLLSAGLPECYRSMAPSMPYFWRSLFKRKLVLWFLATETLAAFWLSGLYGRNWSFLWTQPLSPFATLGMVLFFYGPLWGGLLWVLSKYSSRHSWFVCVFAVGLISPRWAQIMWSTSSLGTSLAWASNAGAYLSLGLFLWLALLDSIQQIGLSMMLLQTLTRIHVAGCLVCIQVLGSFAYMMSRLSPLRPFDIFPNVGLWDWNDDAENLFTTWIFFWSVLVCQVVGSLGYLFWFRQEQLARP